MRWDAVSHSHSRVWCSLFIRYLYLSIIIHSIEIDRTYNHWLSLWVGVLWHSVATKAASRLCEEGWCWFQL